MHILVTRAEPDATALATRLHALGHSTTISPLLDIEMLPVPLDAGDGCTAVLATSRNGLLSLRASEQALSTVNHLPIFTVGTATAKLARDMGFEDVVAGPGTAAELVPLIARRYPKRARFAHLAGDHLAFDLAGVLTAAGHDVKSIEVYRSIAATALRADAEDAVRQQKLDAVILMSPRTARIWSDIVNIADMPARKIAHICLSTAVANALFAGATAHIAQVATLDAIIDAVQSLADSEKAR
jgi:uroporphyrinogen-III synthase